MARIQPLAEAVADNVRDGDAVAMEGFTHLIPYAAGHEVIRQGRRDLFLIRMEAVDDVIFGCANQAGEDNRNVARMSLLLAGLPASVSGTTINRLAAPGWTR